MTSKTEIPVILFLLLVGFIMLNAAAALAVDLQPGESHTSTVNCLFGDGSCPPKPFGTHGGLHKQNVKESGLAHCASCHDHDFFSRTVSVEGTRGCIAPTGNFRPYTQETGPVDERWCEAEPGKLLQVIGSDSACMETGDVAACLMCHGKRFAGTKMDENDHQNWLADNGVKLLPCVACHGGGTEPPNQCDKDQEPEGKNPGDKHNCNLELNCLSCHNQCDERLEKECKDDD